MRKFSTREDSGLRKPRTIFTNVNPEKGIGGHYGGVGPFKRNNHSGCLAIWRAWQAYHMSDDNPNNYVDIAYNAGVCVHGIILEGRSTQDKPKVRGGANGNYQVNTDRLSVVMIWGREDGDPPNILKRAFLEARDWLMEEADAGAGVTPHRDMSRTECPGSFITKWIRAGLPLSKKKDQPPTKPRRSWDGKEFPGRDAFRLGVRHRAVVVLDKRLIAHGYTDHHDGNGYQAGPMFTKYTRENVQDFQHDQGWTGEDADGYPGPVTWARLMADVKRKRRYNPPPFPKGIGPRKNNPSAKELQKALKEAGYMPNWVRLADNYGPQTRAAVARFHDANPRFKWTGVKHDVNIGPKGWDHLFREAYG